MNLVKEESATYRIQEFGINSLTPTELAAKVLCVDKQVIHQIDAEFGLENLHKLSIEQLCKFDNIGKETAVSLLCAFELKRRIDGFKEEPIKIMFSSTVAAQFKHLEDLEHEEFWVLLLNRRNMIKKKLKISQGGYAGTVIDVKMIMAKALEHKAQSIILCHNHPSGNTNRS